VSAHAENELEQAWVARLRTTSAITNSLAAGTAGIYNWIAPQGATYPLIIVSEQSGLDDNVKTGRSRNVLLLCKAITTTTLKAAGVIDEAIDDAFHFVNGESVAQPLTIVGWTIFWQRRASDVRYSERDSDGVLYHHAGGLYRVRMGR
jgi:hypothetical protein